MHLGVILGKFWALPTLSIVHIFSLSINALLRYALLGALVCSSLSVLASTARITTQRGMGVIGLRPGRGQGFQPATLPMPD